jgi:putative sigma-54 modulation protein
MNIQITARHFTASSSLQSTIQEEVSKVQKFYPTITNIDVVVIQDAKEQRSVDITAQIPGATLSVSAAEENFGKTLDTAIERLKTQLKKHNEKQKDYRGTPATAEVVQ